MLVSWIDLKITWKTFAWDKLIVDVQTVKCTGWEGICKRIMAGKKYSILLKNKP